MKVDLFDFDLPESAIAQTPCEPRDNARLLHVGDVLTDSHVHALPSFLSAGDVLVFNNSKVIPARLYGKRGDASIEVLLHHDTTAECEGSPRLWTAFCKPAKKLKLNDIIRFDGGFEANVKGKRDTGEVELSFPYDKATLTQRLIAHGHMPLPPYIRRADTNDDKTRYQTIYAKPEGSVAAPTAGLHFTTQLMQVLSSKGVHTAFVTLHVGAGTFQPVKVDDTNDHTMHAEWAEVTEETAEAINTIRAQGGRVIAVGTTSLRILETAADEKGVLRPFRGDTRIFITPGYRFKLVDRLMTNFHLPRSTLFMLVSAFAGRERMQAAYRHAIDTGYRFYSYGDTSLLERAP